MASKVTEDDWVSFEDEREERLSKLRAIGTGNGGIELIVITGEGEGFNDCRVKTVYSVHIDGEWFSVTEEMKGEGACIVFGESSKIRVTMRVKLSDVADCDEGFDLSLTDDCMGVDMAEDGGFIYQNVTGSFEKGRKIE